MANLTPTTRLGQAASWLRKGLCVGVFVAAFVVLADWNPLPALTALAPERNQPPAPAANVADAGEDAEVVLDHFVYTAGAGGTATKNGNTYSVSTSLTEKDYSTDDNAWKTYVAAVEAAARQAYGTNKPVTITILIHLSTGQTVSIGYTT